MDELSEIRKRVKRVFELRFIDLKPDALTYLANYLKGRSLEDMKEFSGKLVDKLIEKKVDDRPIDLEILKTCLKKDADKKIVFEVVDVENWNSEASAGDIQKFSSFDALRARFANIKSRVEATNLVSIELLYSRTNVVVTVLGMFFQEKNGKYCIEDDTGCLKLKIGTVEFGDGVFFEGGIYEFRGLYNSGVLQLESVRIPRLKPEPRVSIDPNVWSKNDCIVVLSDVWLDTPAVLKMIYKILDGFTHMSPYAFIFCGDFLSPENQHCSLSLSKKGFEHLSNVFRQFKEAYTNTQFIFVPSLHDFPESEVLPRDEVPFKEIYFSDFSNVQFTSNPAKIQCRDQTVVVCRDDIVESICRNAIKIPSETNQLVPAFCQTILSQRHFSPLPIHISPKLLHQDQCFQLCPLPDVLILADRFQSFSFSNSDCTILNPGSFSRSDFEFFVYYTSSRVAEASSCT
uniref:DNA polymerase II subunit 2 n=1 Tax=Panagrolaimus sp. JU765 TaxID=591449 RepID=A0AC34RKY3_9BILA